MLRRRQARQELASLDIFGNGGSISASEYEIAGGHSEAKNVFV